MRTPSCVVVLMLGWYYCSRETGASFLSRPVLTGPNEALNGEVVDLYCDVENTFAKDEHILLELFKEGDRNKALGHSTLMGNGSRQFPIIVRESYDGNMECVASVQNNSVIQPIVSSRHKFKVIVPVGIAKVIVKSDTVEMFEGSKLAVFCNVTAGTYVSYSWLLNGRPVPLSPLHISTHNQLIIYRTTTKDSGDYVCVATNQFNQTTYKSHSTAVNITVKEVVSVPGISFRISKAGFQHYYAVVTCNTMRGTPPITFWLYNRTEMVENKTVDEQNATFTVPVTMDQHSGWLQCQARNENWTSYSKWLNLYAERAAGPLTIQSKYDTGEDFAVIGLTFHCKVKRGSHVRYQWFLNGTLLKSRGDFYLVYHQPPEQSILHLAVRRSSAGSYHCEATDSFDNTTVIKSEKLHVNKEALNRLLVSVVAVVFGCFTFLVTVVTICCCVGVVFRRRNYPYSERKYQSKIEMKSRIAAYEDELDLKEHQEDDDVIMVVGINDSDQSSVSSTESWTQIEEVKKTQED